MKNSIQQREISKAKEIANEYSKKGFSVILEPNYSDLPKELKNLSFMPDIIATSDEINLIIEIKTFESIKSREKELIELAEYVKPIKGWDLELIYTNPKTKFRFPEPVDSSTYANAKKGLVRAAKFLDTDASKEYSDAALLLIWSAVENALRANYLTYKPNEKTSIPKVLVRDSVMMGIIGKKDQMFLESMMRKRNELAHGIFYSKVIKKDLERLIKLGNSVIEQIA